MIGWNFPLNNDGEETGLNDAGIETFRGKPLESLAREINQNSCDATLKTTGKPVEVHFRLCKLPTEKFPDKEVFINILEACKSYWNKNKKTKQFFEKAIGLMNTDYISVLKISDYNTTGLTGSDKRHGSDWHNLIKSVGTSDKGSTSGGSFGIGKHAPFACSQIRTVFYGTKDYEGRTAFQGVSKLVTHENESNKTTQGTGYYGTKERNAPIDDFNNIDEFFERSEIGTDIFVMGFIERKGWENQIIKSVLENFFIAIKDGRLIVKVEDTVINSYTLTNLLNSLIKEDPECLSEKYFNAMTSPNTYCFQEDNFEGLGQIKLFLLPEKNYPKRIAMVRDTGMKIYDKGHFHTPLKFAGVMIASGDNMNQFLKSLEPPSHNAWEYQRYEEDPQYARGFIKKLHAWLNEKVRSLSYNEETEEMDIEGLSQYLPDDLEETPLFDSSEVTEGDKANPKDVQIEIRKLETPKNISSSGNEVAASLDGDEGLINSYDYHHNGGEGAEKTIEEGKITDKEGQDGTFASDETKEPSRKATKINFKHLRTYCIDSDRGIYDVSFIPDLSSSGYLLFNIIGEVGIEPAPIQSAIDKCSGKKIIVEKNGKLGPIRLIADSKYNLTITMEDSLRCALEVSALAD